MVESTASTWHGSACCSVGGTNKKKRNEIGIRNIADTRDFSVPEICVTSKNSLFKYALYQNQKLIIELTARDGSFRTEGGKKYGGGTVLKASTAKRGD